MGLDLTVPRAAPFAAGDLLDRLGADGLPSTIAMVDGQLVLPTAAPPAAWSELRLRTPAGMVTVRRREAAIAVAVFGNADEPLRRAQQQIADAIARL